MEHPIVSVVVPMFNEQEVIAESHRRLSAVMEGLKVPYELVFVNDGSRDNTLAIVRGLREKDAHIQIINFARNFGHQIAVTAGLDRARGDCAVIIDADLQDPPELIPRMVELWREGWEVVYGQREKRAADDSAFKRLTAWGYYRLLRMLVGEYMPLDTGDFRLVDRKVIDTLKSMPEHARFIRAMVAWVGFRQTPLLFKRDERWAGVTKYPFRKMLKLALDGIVSFSNRPLVYVNTAGGAFTAIGVLYALVYLIYCLARRHPVSLMHLNNAIVLFVGGVILIGMGIMGAYIGRMYDEVKGRPLYTLASIEGFEEEKNGEV